MKFLKLFEQYTRFNYKDLVIVDIQPEYENLFGFETSEFIDFLNENYHIFNSITILYNGEDLGMVSETEYTYWLYENGLDEEVLRLVKFYNKGYAFFRYCMDSDIDDEITINLIKYMIDNNINDSREIDGDVWDDMIVYFKDIDEDIDMSDVRELLEHSDDMINIPDLMGELRRLKSGNILLTGGHVEECLREVVLALKSLDLDYETLEEFIY